METQEPVKTIDLDEVVVKAPKPKQPMAAAAIVTSVTSAISGVFSFFTKSKELQIEEENTEQLKLQLQAAEDAALQKTLQAKLSVQMTQLNAAREEDRLKRIGGWVTLLMVTSLIGLVVVQVFRYKREKEKPQAPIIIQ